MYVVAQKLRALQQPLKALHRSYYGNIIHHVDLLKAEFLDMQKCLQQGPMNPSLQNIEKELRNKLVVKSK